MKISFLYKLFFVGALLSLSGCVPAASSSNKVHVFSPDSGAVVESPLLVTGEARGMWYFEASFPIRLETVDGKLLAVGYAMAMADWMTEEYVPFESTLTFDPLGQTTDAVLILSKDNPSGDPALDESVSVPVVVE